MLNVATIPSAFNEIAQQYACLPAIKAEDDLLTYAQLSELAQHYIAPQEQVVIVSDKHSIHLYPQLLGIMRSGKAYFYLAPDSHYEVKKTLQQNIQTRLTKKTLSPAISCLIQTSGTTQQPRLLGLTHAGILHNIKQNQKTLAITVDDKIGLLTSPQFSAANATIYSALLSGACLCLFDLKENDIAAMINWVNREKITILHMTPSLLRLFVKYIPDHYVSSLRAIKVGGETLYPADVALFRKKFAARTLLVNGFGMSEVGGNISHYVLHHHTKLDPDWKVVPVGNVLNGHTVNIENEKITIQSPYLALENWDDEYAIAVKKLITQDNGYFNPQGLLFHVGRSDRVIKYNGYRIDLNAIESALIDLPDIENAYVYFNKKIIACTAGSKETSETLLQALRAKLPPYLLPHKIMCFSAFPMTASGKINQRELMQLSENSDTASFVAPRNELEKNIQQLWQEILQSENIGVYDNFFELGGEFLKSNGIHRGLNAGLSYALCIKRYYHASYDCANRRVT